MNPMALNADGRMLDSVSDGRDWDDWNEEIPEPDSDRLVEEELQRELDNQVLREEIAARIAEDTNDVLREQARLPSLARRQAWFGDE